jgi:hypothetical protein
MFILLVVSSNCIAKEFHIEFNGQFIQLPDQKTTRVNLEVTPPAQASSRCTDLKRLDESISGYMNLRKKYSGIFLAY